MNFVKDFPVEVLWEDTYHDSGWKDDVEEYCKSVKDYQHTIRTVGFIVIKNSKKIIVGMSLTRGNGVGDTMSIPRKCIISILKLKPSAKETDGE